MKVLAAPIWISKEAKSVICVKTSVKIGVRIGAKLLKLTLKLFDL